MLDKSLPYFNIIMKRTKDTPIPTVELLTGYSFVNYQLGDEEDWAKIETSVLEFDTYDEALTYFKGKYSPDLDELVKRSFFIEAPNKEKVATFTVWWDYQEGKKIPSIHWVGVKPNYQGLGLGKALIFEGINRCVELYGECDVYLHTQTWSYKAINLYIKAGFQILETETFHTYENEYERAMPIISTKLNEYAKPH